jgi:hypothetical protein
MSRIKTPTPALSGRRWFKTGGVLGDSVRRSFVRLLRRRSLGQTLERKKGFVFLDRKFDLTDP